MYTTIVVGTDGSEHSLDAVRRAGEIARLAGLESVHVVSACTPMSPTDMQRLEAELPDEFHSLINPRLDAYNHLRLATKELVDVGVTPVEHALDGDPSNAILDVADNQSADLIVVGARGLGALARFVRGSVSTRVAHHSTCDVLIVEHDD